jgi:hypothetical protein
VHRMPEVAAHRAELKAWAEAELTVLEQTRSGGATKTGATALAKTGRKMSMLQTVIREIGIRCPVRCRRRSVGVGSSSGSRCGLYRSWHQLCRRPVGPYRGVGGRAGPFIQARTNVGRAQCALSGGAQRLEQGRTQSFCYRCRRGRAAHHSDLGWQL